MEIDFSLSSLGSGHTLLWDSQKTHRRNEKIPRRRIVSVEIWDSYLLLIFFVGHVSRVFFFFGGHTFLSLDSISSRLNHTLEKKCKIKFHCFMKNSYIHVAAELSQARWRQSRAISQIHSSQCYHRELLLIFIAIWESEQVSSAILPYFSSHFSSRTISFGFVQKHLDLTRQADCVALWGEVSKSNWKKCTLSEYNEC